MFPIFEKVGRVCLATWLVVFFFFQLIEKMVVIGFCGWASVSFFFFSINFLVIYQTLAKAPEVMVMAMVVITNILVGARKRRAFIG